MNRTIALLQWEKCFSLKAVSHMELNIFAFQLKLYSTKWLCSCLSCQTGNNQIPLVATEMFVCFIQTSALFPKYFPDNMRHWFWRHHSWRRAKRGPHYHLSWVLILTLIQVLQIRWFSTFEHAKKFYGSTRLTFLEHR